LNDADLKIPAIESLPAEAARPRWSIMVPTFNAAATIAETLESVLAHGPAAAETQIAVIDNASTDATFQIVQQLSRTSHDRVEIFRHSQNLGLVANWNACIEHARGKLIHILHADDYVRPGFYSAVDKAFSQLPAADLCLVRALVVDAKGEPERLAGRLGHTGDALTTTALAYGNEFYTPGVVVRRACYERLGGFSPALAYVPDWEMWLRVLANGCGVYVNDPLVCYREAPGNVTNRFSKKADDLRELIRFGELISRRVPNHSRLRWRDFLKHHALWAMCNWERAGDETAYRANQAFWRRFASPGEKLDVALTGLKAFRAKCQRPLRQALRGFKKRK
jgi:glycosyltransferase involved in cell wall biosynthesis